MALIASDCINGLNHLAERWGGESHHRRRRLGDDGGKRFRPDRADEHL